MDHSTPINSPNRCHLDASDLPIIPISPIQEEDDFVILEGAKEMVPVSPIQYFDEWIMDQSHCTQYLEFVDGSIAENDSSNSGDSSFNSYISLNTFRSCSNAHSIDNTFFRMWFEADTMDSQLFYFDPIERKTAETEYESIPDGADYDDSGDSHLQKLMQAGVNIRKAIAPNQSLQDIPLKRNDDKIGDAAWALRMVQTAPRPEKESRFSIFKRIIRRK